MINLKKIMVPFDGSVNSILAVKYAASFTMEYGAELHIVHVVETSNFESMDLKLNDPLKVKEKMLKVYYEPMDKKLTDAFGKLIKDLEYRLEIIPGQIVSGLLKYADDEDIDLIIIGSYGEKGFKPSWVGSVSYDMVKKARCPVLTVHNKEKDFVV